MTNALPSWMFNAEMMTKRMLHCSHRLDFNELKNAKKFVLLTTDATARL
jgi:hypothetical protein